MKKTEAMEANEEQVALPADAASPAEPSRPPFESVLPVDGSAAIPERILRIMPWIMAVAMFMENLDATIVNTAVPTIARDLAVQPLALKSVLTSYTLALAVFIPISGWMADKFGTKRVFYTAIGVFACGSLLCGLSVNTGMLVASRIVQGMGGAMMTPVARLVLVRAFPRSQYLQALNYVIIPAMIAPLIGPSIGGLIVHFLPWRTIFFINLPLSVAGIWLARKYMLDFRDAKVAKLDLAGFLMFSGGVGAISYVLEIFGEHSNLRAGATQADGGGGLPWTVYAFFAVSVVLLSAYVWHARRVANPVLNLSLFRVRTFRISVVGGFITRLGIGGMPFLLPLLYQVGLGFPPWLAGLLTVPQAFASIGMKIVCRVILARFGHKRVLAANTVLLGCNIIVFSFVGPGTPIWLILPLSFLQGFWSSLQFTSMNSLIYADIDNRDASKAGSIASTGQQMALSFGVATASLVAGFFLSHVPQTQSDIFINGLHKTFLALGVFTILTSFMFRPLRPEDGATVSHYKPKTAKI